MATIRDIAKAAGVSAGAVSRILNQDATLNVSSQTRERVLSIAAELNYVNRRKQKTSVTETQPTETRTFGILQWYSLRQELEDSYYLSIRLGAEKYCAAHGISVIRAFKGDTDYLLALQGVDGLICIGKFANSEIEQFKKISSHYILVDMCAEQISHNAITLDFAHATTAALDYLTSLGHTHIGYLGGKEYMEDGSLYQDTRQIVFEDYCLKHDITYQPYLSIDAYTIEAGYDMMSKLIAGKTLPTAVFTASDSIALGAMRALSEHGYHIPADISIIGFDNINASAYSTPPLTTIGAPAELMGEYAANFLSSSRSVYEEYHIPVQMMLPCTLIERDSCAPRFSGSSPKAKEPLPGFLL